MQILSVESSYRATVRHVYLCGTDCGHRWMVFTTLGKSSIAFPLFAGALRSLSNHSTFPIRAAYQWAFLCHPPHLHCGKTEKDWIVNVCVESAARQMTWIFVVFHLGINSWGPYVHVKKCDGLCWTSPLLSSLWLLLLFHCRFIVSCRVSSFEFRTLREALGVSGVDIVQVHDYKLKNYKQSRETTYYW